VEYTGYLMGGIETIGVRGCPPSGSVDGVAWMSTRSRVLSVYNGKETYSGKETSFFWYSQKERNRSNEQIVMF
jgi:hypothetical protein